MSSTPTLAAIEEQLATVDFSGLPAVRIGILRNITVEPIAPMLRYEAYRSGLAATITFGEYDNILQDATAGSEVANSESDVIIVFAWLDQLSSKLARQFIALTGVAVAEEEARLRAFIDATLAALRSRTRAVILWNGFATPLHPALGILDQQAEYGQTASIRRLNDHLRQALRRTGDAYYVDTDACIGRVGATPFFDWRYWHIGRAPFGREGLRQLAAEHIKFVRATKGLTKKCLVLDCDDVLWGGVVGEDGVNGVRIGSTHPGSSYADLQQEVVNLHHRGVLVALCSKNNPEDVWQVFRERPEMLLKEAHIATAQINWRDKVENLRRIAGDLNIGIDALVFADDSPFELNLVERELPGVALLRLPVDRPSEFSHVVAACGLFDALTISDEDRGRGAMYRAEAGRMALKVQATDVEGYLRSLEMAVWIERADERSIPRIAQQTQRTNQFNLTTRRYTDGEIAALAVDENADVLALRLRDKLGDSGIVATAILRYSEDVATLDTFLVSCRALGRGIEDVLLSEGLEVARARGCRRVLGEYCSTPKNTQVAGFYPTHGFKLVARSSNEARLHFEFDLMSGLGSAVPAFFLSIAGSARVRS